MDDNKVQRALISDMPVIRFSRVEIARNKRARADRINAERIEKARGKSKNVLPAGFRRGLAPAG